MQTSDQESRAENRSTSQPGQLAEFIGQVEKIGAVLALAASRLAATIEPIGRALNDYLERPEVQAGIRKAERAVTDMHDRVQAIDAPGYTPYFERMGHDGLSARLHAGVVRSLARRFYEEAQDKRIALSAFHDLAKRPRWHPALARQVARLRDHGWNADFLNQAFDQVGCPELKDEFLNLVRGTGGGDFNSGPRLIEIAARLAPHAPSPRGRHLRFETVLHQTFLHWSAHAGGRQGYTYGLVQDGDEVVEDFIDEATAATRIELRRPSFNPVAARRAERKRLAREPRTEPRPMRYRRARADPDPP